MVSEQVLGKNSLINPMGSPFPGDWLSLKKESALLQGLRWESCRHSSSARNGVVSLHDPGGTPGDDPRASILLIA